MGTRRVRICGIALALTACGGAALADGVLALPCRMIEFPDPVLSATIGDIDNDGDAEILATDGARIHVLHAEDGQSGEEFTPPYGAQGSFLTIARVNADEWPDLALWTYDGLRVFWGPFSGRVVTVPSSIIDTYYFQSGICDIDGDGQSELVYAPESAPVPELRVARGSGNSLVTSRLMLLDASVRAVIAADTDGDADSDIIVQAEGSLRHFRNDGDHGFTEWGRLDGVEQGILVRARLDQDGRDDCVHVTYNPTRITSVHAEPDGSLRIGATFSVTTWADEPWVVDIDGDDDDDLLIGFAIGKGIGLTPMHVAKFVNDGKGVFRAAAPLVVGGNPAVLGHGDVDGDGDLDVAVRNLAGGLSIVRNDGPGSFHAGRALEVGPAPGIALSADIDSDGDLDLLCSDDVRGELIFFENVERQTFAAPQVLAGWGRTEHAAACDIDLDGDVDVIGSSVNSDVCMILRNVDGQGTLEFMASVAITDPTCFALGRFNDDPLPDLAIGSDDGRVVIALNNGAGGFAPLMTMATGERVIGIEAMALDDAVGDEIVVARAGPESFVEVFRRNGSIYERTQTIPTGYARSLAKGDLDADARDDAMVAHSVGQLTFMLCLRNDGSGNLVESATFKRETVARQLVIADFDANGTNDIGSSDSFAECIRVNRNMGGWSFAPTESFMAGGTASRMVAADFDRDQDADVAVINSSYRSVTWMENRSVHGPPPCPADANGDTFVDGADLSIVLSLFGHAAPAYSNGDINGDGMIDAADLSVLLANFGVGC